MKLASVIASVLALVAACKTDEKKPEAPPAKAPNRDEPAPRVEPTPAPPAPAAAGGGRLAGLGGKLGDLFAGAAPELELPGPAPKGGDCDAVADRLGRAIEHHIESQLAQLPAEEREATRTMIGSQTAGTRDQLVTMCATEAWSAELRDCALTATSVAQLEACDRYAPAVEP